ncbi:hypothetical protein WG901_16460 [Novosphingobium sp. PS1R-30]|uniref:Permease n=1 Tax=Novosphingobium anseongense TaxID=3133436 RepID=A0ABU8RZZ7_9SPHN|nr:MAG: hypothetical protein EOO76_03100 [Novosphingobium sp.]
MNFVQWLNSLDEFLYELMSWIVFFPVTMGKILRHPLQTMEYAEAQLSLAQDDQYRAAVSPPVFLILTLMVCQALELTVFGVNPVVASKHGLAALVNDNTTLLLLRLMLFGMFPLVLATRMVRKSALDLDRETLKAPFYAQCYAVAPFALMLSIGASITHLPIATAPAIGLGIVAAAFLFYGLLQVRWFAIKLEQSLAKAMLIASIGLIESIVFTFVIAALFAF